MNQQVESSSNADRVPASSSDQQNSNVSVINSTENLNDSASNSDEWKSIEDQDNDQNDWPDFQSKINDEKKYQNSTEEKFDDFQSNPEKNQQIDDDFGQFCESSTFSENENLNEENIHSVILNCFPSEFRSNFEENQKVRTLSKLPTFTTYEDKTKIIDDFFPSLFLWKNLSNATKDPIGIQYQWKNSKIEQLFHRALKVTRRSAIFDENVSTNEEINEESKVEDQNANFLGSTVEEMSFDRNNSTAIDSTRKIIETLNPRVCAKIKTSDLFPGSNILIEESPTLTENTKTHGIQPATLLLPLELNGIKRGQN